LKKKCIIFLAQNGKNKTFNMVELNQLLLEFESNLTREAVTKEWKERRDSWVREVQAAVEPSQLAEFLVELESDLDREAVQNHWMSGSIDY
jgi:7,8-dihydro-6-hydroxymethylpterin-pyrophosphokinase